MAPLIPLLLLGACGRDPTSLSFVMVDGGSVSLPVTVSGFAGYRLDIDEPMLIEPRVVAPRWLPVGLSVPQGRYEDLAVLFDGDAFRLRGTTTGGTPFSLRVTMGQLSYGAARLDEPALVLVLDGAELIDGAAIDEDSVAADPEPKDGQPFPMSYDPSSDLAQGFVSAAPTALWLGRPADAAQRYAGRWPYTEEQLSGAPGASSGCGSGGGVAIIGPVVADSGVPDTGTAPADTAWITSSGGADSAGSSSGGCGGGADSADTGSGSAGSEASADTGGGSGGCGCGSGDSGFDSVGDTSGGGSGGGCGCSKGGDSVDSAALAPGPAGRRWLGFLAFLGPLLALRRRR